MVFLQLCFIACLVFANLTANKICILFGIQFPAGVLTYPITFLITDIMSEIKGKHATHKLVNQGFIINIIIIGLVFTMLKIPQAMGSAKAFQLVFSSTWRIIIASMVAYFISQHIDVILFHFWKNLTKGKWLWLRNNGSTIISQFFDSTIFCTIAFYGILPNNILFNIIVGQYIMKWCIALLDTPFCYFGVWYYKSHGEKTYEISWQAKYFKYNYYKHHKYCPQCGYDKHSSTFLGTILDLKNKHKYKDNNSVKCSRCGWTGIVHDLVSGEKRIPFTKVPKKYKQDLPFTSHKPLTKEKEKEIYPKRKIQRVPKAPDSRPTIEKG